MCMNDSLFSPRVAWSGIWMSKDWLVISATANLSEYEHWRWSDIQSPWPILTMLVLEQLMITPSAGEISAVSLVWMVVRFVVFVCFMSYLPYKRPIIRSSLIWYEESSERYRNNVRSRNVLQQRKRGNLTTSMNIEINQPCINHRVYQQEEIAQLVFNQMGI